MQLAYIFYIVNCFFNISKAFDPMENDTIYIGFLASYREMRVTLGALPLAIEHVNLNQKLLPGKRLLFKAFDIGQRAERYHVEALRVMTRLRQEGVSAFLGPDKSCSTEALLSSAWNIPMLSFKCSDSSLSNKDIFHTFARTLAPASKVSKSVISLLNAFHWHKFSIVYSAKPFWGSEVAKAIQELAINENITVSHFKEIPDYIPMEKTITNMQKIIDETFETTRIYVFVGEQFDLIDFLRCLQNKKLLLDGNYLVIAVDDEIYDFKRPVKNIERNYLDRYIRKDKSKSLDMHSFRSVIKISVSFPQNPKMGELLNQIKDYARIPPFYVPYHERVYDNISVPIYGLHLYDTVLIYAKAITEILKANGNIYNGAEVMKKIFDSSYHSIQGFDVHIDENGDAEGNYTLISLQKDGNSDSLVKMYMQSVGYFVYNKQSYIPEFRYIKADRHIQWVKGRPPLAEPICGYNDELCRMRKIDWSYLFIAAFFTFLLVIAALLLIKHFRYEQTLASLLWKIEMREVTILNTNEQTELQNSQIKNIYQVCRQSIVWSGENKHKSYTTIGLYRGNIVALKKIHNKTVDITRSVRKEFKQIRELRHENLIGFYGVSLDQGAVYIFTTYCPRGSLEDVLMNKDIKLDQMFISSLVSDILKGLIYLHDSEIISHGNLRSSNCLIDSRWVCQISDFGLHEFKSGQEEPNHVALELKRSLWRAPELLRDASYLPRGTQKADVYSFGIIFYEIICRKGPWGEIAFSPEEIVAFVKDPQLLLSGIFRPPTSQLDIPDYMKQCLCSCWEEDPDLRPDIRLVRMKLKPLNTGLKANIFDNMLSIMEKYAFNLEGLVQARTHQLTEEKKKTEMLLHQMLPCSVVESLKCGTPVQPEVFDCVTIMFSDIVGFTQLCATFTPFEEVDILNDLYTCCDSIISNYDVYKVETIGDAYMVVSGLPIRNGNRHAAEIASLALNILEVIANFRIRNRPNEKLKFRIGIHSGPCAAGVVGLKMPRYCLFGDTVNTTARMESSGEAMKIHISGDTYQLLQTIGGYICKERGFIKIKEKGDMRTHWLISRSSATDPPPDLIKYMNEEVTLNTASNKHVYRIFDKPICQCATKTLYYSSSADVLITKTHHNYTVDEQNFCVCQLQRPFISNVEKKPSSAPTISFRL